ncbi:FAD binding domain protein [Aspergillus lentulus]|uniref:FAD-dependent monooxygenase pyr5 n=1 Tax=Aspergillus lentulus TaxID=293939 RepID=UPI001394AFC2|nr:FAD binding domain protein [Aspergillus lentulus]GFF51697.1 FAD binding domain protein [Aspergillus lentulus]GFF73933.1 FAD binding domain protein [Aspergillus lentulus]GFF75263.1 FAD binding domain protein [Aspergillus lentulus]GFG15774.1 FAD binding domain protein [Aspergillus lentulus]
MKVLIIGGSIAGLTLAHCLEKAKIDYVLLEKKEEIAPQEGASIGIMPNGGRIMEQLGLYHQIEQLIEPLARAHVTYPDGFHFTSQYPALLQQRFGYPLAFLDRQKLLQILAAGPVQSSRVKLGHQVVNIESTHDGVTVRTSNGHVYQGDLVVGADGVHSRIRAEMWRLANASQGEIFRKLTINYACIFGISSPVDQLEPGEQITCYNDGWSILSVIGQNGRVFWFLFIKLEKEFVYDGSRENVPRFSPADARAHCERLVHEPVWNGVEFGHVWAQCEVFQMTPLEEGLFSKWHWRNIICIGDSMHKVSSLLDCDFAGYSLRRLPMQFAPHIGQGANCAIEDAAQLSNRLRTWLYGCGPDDPPAAADLSEVLAGFVEDRLRRLGPVAVAARSAMRLHSRHGLKNRILGRYLLPYAGDKPADWASRGIAGGITLEFVEPPERSGPGWIQFSQPRKRPTFSLTVAGLCLVAIVIRMLHSTLVA